MVFKLIPWNYPFSSWVGYGTLDMIEGGGHSHESRVETAASSHICNKVCRKIIRMPAYLNPHKRRDEKSGSAQQGEKLGCGHHHAETHQSPIETSSISPSYTPYAAAERRWKISALKMDDSTWESWLMRKSFIKDVFLLHFFCLKGRGVLISTVSRCCLHAFLTSPMTSRGLTAASPPSRHRRRIPDSWWCKAKNVFKRSKISDNILSNYL